VAHLACVGLSEVPSGAWFCEVCLGAGAAQGSASPDAQAPRRPLLPFGDGNIEWAEVVKYLGVYFEASCGLGVEIASRIKNARAAFRKLRPLFAGGGRLSGGVAAMFARTFASLVETVLLYGSEAWALSSAELARLERVQRSMLRQTLPPAQRRTMSTVDLYKKFKIPTVGTLWVRSQLRWLGHMARAGDTRIAKMMLGAARDPAGNPGKGNHGVSLVGACGRTGRLKEHLDNFLGNTALKKRIFGSARANWVELAHDRAKWQDFVKNVKYEEKK
jgi:hypothetical protein